MLVSLTILFGSKEYYTTSGKSEFIVQSAASQTESSTTSGGDVDMGEVKMLQHNSGHIFYVIFRGVYLDGNIAAFILSKRFLLVILRIGTFDELLQVRQREKQHLLLIRTRDITELRMKLRRDGLSQ